MWTEVQKPSQYATVKVNLTKDDVELAIKNFVSQANPTIPPYAKVEWQKDIYQQRVAVVSWNERWEDASKSDA